MIRVDRSRVPAPAALTRTYTSGVWKGRTERERVLAELAKHKPPPGSDDTFSFDYKVYRDPEVKRALATLFHGKCAYCESRYAGTQPMDVEHWRPKAEVHVGRPGTPDFRRLPGYPWMASDWDNLLPSCIDCNRVRSQIDVVTGQVVNLGKANEFPVVGDVRLAPPFDGAPPTVDEQPLLLNPCLDEPGDYLEFTGDGAVLARNDDMRAVESIRVYALNRTELALDRLGVRKLIDQRLFAVDLLHQLLAANLDADVRMLAEELLAHEIAALLDMTEPTQPFSAMARQIIAEEAPIDL